MADSLDFENGGTDDGEDRGARAIVPADITEALGARLIALGKLDNEGFRRASRIREETGDRFNQILTKLGLVSERDMAEVLADQLEEPLVRAGVGAILSSGSRALRGQMRQANALEIPYVAILGDDEIARGEVMIRDMKTSTQEARPLTEFLEFLEGLSPSL